MMINKSREDVIAFVMDTIKTKGVNYISITFGRISENGYPVIIEGENKEMQKLKVAFEIKGETANIHE